MNSAQLVERIATKSGLSKRQTKDIVSQYINEIQTAVKKGEVVRIAGFGKFELTRRKARKGRNPQTGEAVKISAKKVPVFKAGTAFRDLVATSRVSKKPKATAEVGVKKTSKPGRKPKTETVSKTKSPSSKKTPKTAAPRPTARGRKPAAKKTTKRK